MAKPSPTPRPKPGPVPNPGTLDEPTEQTPIPFAGQLSEPAVPGTSYEIVEAVLAAVHQSCNIDIMGEHGPLLHDNRYRRQEIAAVLRTLARFIIEDSEGRYAYPSDNRLIEDLIRWVNELETSTRL